MVPGIPSTAQIEVVPVTAERWPELETLFGKSRACAGCWCMFWRLSRADFRRLQGEGKKARLQELTLAGQVPGLLATVDGLPAGWCSLGPRESYPALDRSRSLRRVDDQPVWSIVCFFVARPYRHSGLLTALLRGALAYAGEQGARIVEAYPIDTQSPPLLGKKLTSMGGYMGIASVFRALGFVEVAQASETQRIMRYLV